MKLSMLQKYILGQALQATHSKTSRAALEKFYDKQKNPPAKKIQANIITKSIERLIDKGLLIGYGQKTQHKLFIQQIKLTPCGKKTALGLLGKQAELPFGKKR